MLGWECPIGQPQSVAVVSAASAFESGKTDVDSDGLIERRPGASRPIERYGD
jgi:hypothetical protein